MSKSRARNWTSRFPAFFICRRQHDGSSDSALLYMQHGLVLQAAGDIAHLYEYTCCSPSNNITPVIPDGCIDVMFDITSEEISARAAGTVPAGTRVPMEQGHPDFGIRFEPGVIPIFLDGAFRELPSFQERADHFTRYYRVALDADSSRSCRSDSAALFFRGQRPDSGAGGLYRVQRPQHRQDLQHIRRHEPEDVRAVHPGFPEICWYHSQRVPPPDHRSGLRAEVHCDLTIGSLPQSAPCAAFIITFPCRPALTAPLFRMPSQRASFSAASARSGTSRFPLP